MKRLLSLLTVMLMLVTVFALSVTANAANTYLSVVTEEGTTDFSRGDTVTLIYSTSYTGPIDVFAAEYNYSDDVLQPVTGKKNTKWFPESDYDCLASINTGDKLAAFALTTDPNDPQDVSTDLSGDVLQLKFKIKDAAPFGQHTITLRLRHERNNQLVVDETVTLTINIACTNHSYISEVDAQYLVSEANCQSPAIYKKSCEHCGAASATETFENGTKLDHTYTNGWVTDGDDTHTRKCDNFAVCGYSETLAHNWDGGTVTDEPSCFEKGTMTYTCTDGCGATKEEDIDPTNAHVWGAWADNGDNHVRYCTTVGCGEPNYADHDWSHNCDTLCDTCGHTRTVVHIYGHVATADEHWNACSICGDIQPGSRAPHNVVNGECVDCGYKTSRPMSGFFYVNDDYHMMILTDGVITGHHILDVNGDCTICGAHISDVVEDEIVIEAPVESDTEETETEPVVNPTTGLAFALITVAAAAAVAVASKKH